MHLLTLLIHFNIPLNAIGFVLLSIGVPQQAIMGRNRKYSRSLASYQYQSNQLNRSEDAEENVESAENVSIAIVGSGAVGSYYGARLHETNLYNVMFFMRGDHYKVSKECGLKVTSIQDDIFIPADQLNAYDKLEDIGKVDWVILALKSTAIEATPELLMPLLREDTRVICAMNGFVDEDIVRLLEGETDENVEPNLTRCGAVYAGMAFLCSNRVAPGCIDHSFAGKLCASLVKSSSDDSKDIELHQQMIKDLWEPTKVQFEYEPIYTKARWTKNIWNLPFNGISVALSITVDKVVNDPGLRSLAYKIMDETIAIANKDMESRGYSEEDFLGEEEVRKTENCTYK